MARATQRIASGGGAVVGHHAVDQPYYLRAMPGNPFIGAVHDGHTEGYMKGFSVKPIHWLYRFRHNSQPIGIPTGFYNRNPGGKQVHWLEVSTIEKVRVQIVGEEFWAPGFIIVCSCAFILTQFVRYMANHPDLSLYNLVLWTSKPFVLMARTGEKYAIDQPIFKYVQRPAEFYAEDPIRHLYRLGVAANDPFVEAMRAAGRESELWMSHKEYTSTKPNYKEVLVNKDQPTNPYRMWV